MGLQVTRLVAFVSLGTSILTLARPPLTTENLNQIGMPLWARTQFLPLIDKGYELWILPAHVDETA